MGSSRKKVIVRMENGSVQAGYLPSGGLSLSAGEAIDLLEVGGRTTGVPLAEIRYVAYVRDFNLDDRETPERLTRKVFLARPRTEGLWVRLTFHDGEVLEGLAPLDASLLDDAIADAGVFLIPPDVRSNTQRMFVPRTALRAMQMLAVVTTPSKAAAARRIPAPEEPRLAFPDLPLG